MGPPPSNPNKKRKERESLEMTIFCCGKCEKEIEANSPSINCLICTSSFHLHPDCAPASLFHEGKCILPEWMKSSFVCSKECSEMGVAGNPLFIAMQKENNEIKERLAIVEERLAHFEKNCERTICNTLDEMEERSIRKNNIIIFNVDESGSEDSKVRQDCDTNEVKTVLDKIGVSEVRFERCIRLGKRGQVGGKPRPIRVRIDSFDDKITILKKSNSLRAKGRESQRQTPFITSDLTVMQRKLRKELIDELKARLDEGENVRIDWRTNSVVKKNF
jgi:hypothetical protein